MKKISLLALLMVLLLSTAAGLYAIEFGIAATVQGIKISENERCNRQSVYDMCQDQPRQATVKLDGPQGLEQRNQNDLVRNEHAEQEKCKDNFTALEFPFGKDISVDGS